MGGPPIEVAVPVIPLVNPAADSVARLTGTWIARQVALGTLFRGMALAGQGQSAAGLAQMQQGLAAVRATGTVAGMSGHLAQLAEAYGQVGQVDERFKQRFAVWLVRTAYDEWGMASGIYALSTVCTHLGCTPNWLEAEQKFKCPCHGSGYYKTGVNFEGPTPRPLERYAISLADDGQILVDKSRKFQEEKGEWNNPAAFLKL